MCSDCGPRPDYLCMDGVCIGMSSELIRNEKESDLKLKFSDKPTLDAPVYKERMFIREKKHRDLLRNACLKNKIPDLRGVKFDKDPKMTIVKKFVEGIKCEGNTVLPKEYADVMLDISSVSSTISMLQINKTNLLNKLKHNLSSDAQIMCDPVSRI